ncbi:MAG TPA: hypothetical protein PKD63_04430, partial [Solirubrobacteraceae bacterium]|nr:hypothetical protein [Solirubrobacteraceae bacterium]
MAADPPPPEPGGRPPYRTYRTPPRWLSRGTPSLEELRGRTPPPAPGPGGAPARRARARTAGPPW